MPIQDEELPMAVRSSGTEGKDVYNNIYDGLVMAGMDEEHAYTSALMFFLQVEEEQRKQDAR